jgi:hypothetical protein
MKWLKNSIQLVGSVHQEIAAMPADARRKGWARVAVVLVIAACIAALTGCSDNQAEKAAQEQAQKEAARKAAMKEAFNVGDPTQNKHKGFKGGWPPAGGKKEAQK